MGGYTYTPPTKEELSEFEAKEQEPSSYTYTPPTSEEISDFESNENKPLTRKDQEFIFPREEVTGAAIGAGIGSIPGLLAEGAGVLTEGVGRRASPYTPSQLELLSNEYKTLKNINPEDTMRKVGEQFSSGNRQINELEKEAYANLSEPITRQEYRQTAMESTKPFTREIDQTTPEFLSAVKESTPEFQTINPMARQEAQQLEDFASKKASEVMEGKKAASLGTIPEEQLLADYNALKNQIKANKEGFTFKPDVEKGLQDFTAQQKLQASSAEKAKNTAIKKLETPLAGEFPELKGRLYSSAYADVEKDLSKILNRYKKGELLAGEDAYKVIRDIRESVFSTDGSIKIGEDAAKAVQKSIRDLVGEKNPEADALFKEMSSKITDLKKLEKAGYIKRDTKISKESPDFIKFGQKEQKKIIEDIAPNLYKSGVDVSDDVANRLIELKKSMPEKLYKELELSILKIAMEDPKKAATLSTFDVALGAVSPTFAGSKYLGKLVSSPTGSLNTYRTGKAIQKVAKPLAVGGALLGGVLGGPLGAFAGEAIQEGFDSETSGASPDSPDYWLEKGVKDPEEQKLRAFKSTMEKAPSTGMDQGTFTAEKYAQDKAVAERNKQYKQEVLDEKNDEFLSPDNYVEQEPKRNTDSFFKTLDSSKPILKDIKFNSTDGPEMTQFADAMDASGDKAAQEYSRVLRQVISSPDSKKEAVLFTLNQQPAFRALVKKMKEGQ